MSSIQSTTALALASAALAVASGAFAASPPKGASGAAVAADDKVHCYNINSCKGTADCKTADNQCKGQNGCKGQGFKAETAKSCLGKGGVIGDIKS
ncbi:MAG: hypothetical protein RIT26_2585 [Pseudomonadota bacterium]|jgi:hypothetical protein